MNAHDLYVEATLRGLRLEPAGDKLAVFPKGHCPPDFADLLRQHKRELLYWLETKDTHLSHDYLPWLHVARQILAGEFATTQTTAPSRVSPSGFVASVTRSASVLLNGLALSKVTNAMQPNE